RFVEMDVRAAEHAGELVTLADLDRRAELVESVDVRIEPAAPDHVSAGRRNIRVPVAREQRAGREDRRADAARKLLVHVGTALLRVHANVVLARPLDVGSEMAEQLD